MAEAAKKQAEKKPANPLINLAAGGISGAISKTITAPLEKVKLAIQNQDSNPKILSGEMKRYTGMGAPRSPSAAVPHPAVLAAIRGRCTRLGFTHPKASRIIAESRALSSSRRHAYPKPKSTPLHRSRLGASTATLTARARARACPCGRACSLARARVPRHCALRGRFRSRRRRPRDDATITRGRPRQGGRSRSFLNLKG